MGGWARPARALGTAALGVLLVLVAVAARAERPEAATSYRIAKGDTVSIAVYDEPDLSLKQVLVGGDGLLSFPLIGEIRVTGLTASELESAVSRRLRDGYLKKPHVTVSIDSYRLFFIKGEVKRPGGYSYVEGLTVAKAIAMARGFTERAAESKITIEREAAGAPLPRISPATPILPGDVITIGESFF